jgi:hypothetical protein
MTDDEMTLFAECTIEFTRVRWLRATPQHYPWKHQLPSQCDTLAHRPPQSFATKSTLDSRCPSTSRRSQLSRIALVSTRRFGLISPDTQQPNGGTTDAKGSCTHDFARHTQLTGIRAAFRRESKRLACFAVVARIAVVCGVISSALTVARGAEARLAKEKVAIRFQPRQRIGT